MQDYLKQIIKEAGAIAKGYFHKGVTHRIKAHLGDYLTEADEEVSEHLIKRILERYPLHSINSEEREEEINPGHEYRWVIDPIDGTRNFANAIPFWCIMVAVLYRDQSLMSAIYNPLADELFFAEAEKGATLNGMPIKVNEVASFDHGFAIVGRGYDTQYEEEFKRMVCRLANEQKIWMHNFATMLGVCYVATGGADFFAFNAGFDFDYLAVALICREAGALVTDIEGNPWKPGRRDLVIANPKLHPKVLELFR